MRVLFCNWVDPFDPERRGGGVAVYQRNMHAPLRQAGIEIGYLSAGLAHELRGGAPRWQKIHPLPAQGEAHFEIVNSATLAPGQASFGDPRQIRDAETSACFEDFLLKTGPWDAVHFDNIEGFPAEVLAIAAQDPARRVVVMLHNYYPFCPQVNLWFQERKTCGDFQGGEACASCLTGGLASAKARRMNMAISWHLGRRFGPKAVGIWRQTYGRMRQAASWAVGLRRAKSKRKGADEGAPSLQSPPSHAALPDARAIDTPAGRAFGQRRADMVSLINRHADAVLCVSDRVRQIAQGFGIAPEKLHTTRIGSPEAGRLRQEPLRAPLTPEGRLHLAYLGYMRRDKGFYFLLDALEAMPTALLSRLELSLAAKRAEPETMARLEALGQKLAGYHYHDGYRHDQLDGILAPVTLGLVPVLWEDNLPQVALEMHLRGIPLLCSDLGGAQELAQQPHMTFGAGDKAALQQRLEGLLDHPLDPAAYREAVSHPLSIEAHLKVLLPHWQNSAR